MKKLLTIYLLFITITSSAQNHKKYCTEENCKSRGLVEEEGSIINGKKEGHWKYNYGCIKGHILHEEGNYENDKKVGLWKEYYDNGTLKSVGEMMNNEDRLGSWKIYHNNGQLSASGIYKENGYPLENSWTTYNRRGQKDSVNCPEPTKSQIIDLFNAIYGTDLYEGPYKFAYKYQEILWQMSAANPEEYLPSYPVQKWEVLKEIAGYQKVLRMWNKYNVIFSCDGFVTNIASGKNIMKFALDAEARVLILEAVKKYHFDLNFIDPSDGKTILDFITDRIAYFRNAHPREGTSEAAIKDYEIYNENRIRDYQRIYDLLRSQGVKHANELK